MERLFPNLHNQLVAIAPNSVDLHHQTSFEYCVNL
jgi:hypothetical protein